MHTFFRARKTTLPQIHPQREHHLLSLCGVAQLWRAAALLESTEGVWQAAFRSPAPCGGGRPAPPALSTEPLSDAELAEWKSATGARPMLGYISGFVEQSPGFFETSQ